MYLCFSKHSGGLETVAIHQVEVSAACSSKCICVFQNIQVASKPLQYIRWKSLLRVPQNVFVFFKTFRWPRNRCNTSGGSLCCVFLKMYLCFSKHSGGLETVAIHQVEVSAAC